MRRVLKWPLFVLAVLAGCSAITLLAFVSNKMLAAQRDAQAREEAALVFAQLPPEARRLAIYDAACRLISEHYFDRNFSGVDWPALQRDWRPKAAAARDDKALYDEVLSEVTARFPVSHLTLHVPAAARARVNAATGKPVRMPNVLHETGARLALLNRGGKRLWVVAEVARGSPAERAGVEPGWVMIEPKPDPIRRVIDVKFLRLRQPDQTVLFEKSFEVRYPAADTEEKLRAEASAAELTVELAATEPAPEIKFAIARPAPGMLYVRLDSLGDDSMMSRFLRTLDETPHESVILDLRNNTGGNKREINRMFERMLPPSTLVGFDQHAAGRKAWRTSNTSTAYGKPVAVLIGPKTFSAGEIAAAVLRDAAAAHLIGRMTAGAVITSRFYPLPDGGGLMVPVQDFWLPNGDRIEGNGVEPDMLVFASLADVRAGRDPALDRAIAELGVTRPAR